MASAFSGVSLRSIHTKFCEESRRDSMTSRGTSIAPESNWAASDFVFEFAGNGESRVYFDAHGQRVHVAVVNGAALGRNFDDALLLALRAVSGNRDDGKVAGKQAAKNGRGPQQSHASDDQQTDVGSIWLHRNNYPATPSSGTSEAGLREYGVEDCEGAEGLRDCRRPRHMEWRLLRAIHANELRRGHFRASGGLVFMHLRRKRFRSSPVGAARSYRCALDCSGWRFLVSRKSSARQLRRARLRAASSWKLKSMHLKCW